MMNGQEIGNASYAIGPGGILTRINKDGVVTNKNFTDLPCPICGELCPVERLDKHVEIIECCNRKFVVAVDGVLTERFKND